MVPRNTKKTLILLFIALCLSGCGTLGAALTTSTPVFPPSNPFEELPTLKPAISPTPTPVISETPEASTATLTPPPTSTLEVPPPEPLVYEPLAAEIEQITAQAGGRWHIVIQQVEGPLLYTQFSDWRINIASVVKIPVALLFFEAIEQKGISEDQLVEHLQTTGVGGRTFEQLLSAMLVKSEEKATAILLDYIPTYVNIPVQLADWDLGGLDLASRRYTAAGVASMFERLYLGDFVSPAARQLILDYLSEYTPNDDTRIGLLSTLIPENYHLYNKRGSLLTPYVVADCAILEDEGGIDYLLIVFAYQGEQKTTYEVLDEALGEIALAFWYNRPAESPD